MGLQMGSLGRWGGHLGGCRTNQHSCIFMRQWVKAAYLTRASVTRTHEYAFRKTSCDSLWENAIRGAREREYELVDTGAFDDDRYWIVEVRYAKADPHDLLMEVQVTNAGRAAAQLHVLPTVWFRNTWAWDLAQPRPHLEQTGPATVGLSHPFLGRLELVGGAAPGGLEPELLFCDNETNCGRLFGAASTTAYPKDGINDHVTAGAATVNPDHCGTRCSFWYQLTVPGGDTTAVRLRLRPEGLHPDGSLGADFDEVIRARRAEADEFYGELRPTGISADEAAVMRQAFASLLWSK